MFGSDHEYYLAAWAPEWNCGCLAQAVNIKYLDGWPEVQNKIKIAKAFVTLGCLGMMFLRKGATKKLALSILTCLTGTSLRLGL